MVDYEKFQTKLEIYLTNVLSRIQEYRACLRGEHDKMSQEDIAFALRLHGHTACVA
jgi:hypothetical protein